MRLLEKYGLTDYIESFRIRGVFPTQLVWNKLVKQRISQHETVELQNRISDARWQIKKVICYLVMLISPYFLVYIMSMNHTFSGIDLK